jgi:hypothetical protein
VFIRRLFPNRWARILAWTGAALAWASVAVGAAIQREMADASTTESPSPARTSTTTGAQAAIPSPPPNGLVIIRYQPVAAPAPEVIVRNVTGASTGPPSPAAASPTVSSSGS